GPVTGERPPRGAKAGRTTRPARLRGTALGPHLVEAAFTRALPAEVFTPEPAGIWISAPVCGLRPVRAARSTRSTDSRPVILTASPLLTDSTSTSCSADRAASAWDLVSEERSATAATSSVRLTDMESLSQSACAPLWVRGGRHYVVTPPVVAFTRRIFGVSARISRGAEAHGADVTRSSPVDGRPAGRSRGRSGRPRSVEPAALVTAGGEQREHGEHHAPPHEHGERERVGRHPGDGLDDEVPPRPARQPLGGTGEPPREHLGRQEQ